ncbi:hypothetical protein [Nocardia sp. NPDC020380]|uniref:hypothetical protein n=1 Tax=Nocardia sp. NPDC020380 TaxID=3364309 RepID=UPI0037B3EB73
MGGLTRPALLAAALALTLTACGAKGSAPLPTFQPTVAPPSGQAAAALDEITLRGDLIDVTALPSGFTALPDPPPGSTSGAGSTTNPPQCAKVLAAIADQVPGATGQAAAQFGGNDFASVDVDAASYPNGMAAQAFSTVQSLVRECAKYSGKDADGTNVEFRAGGLDQPQAGNASTAFQLNTTSQGLTLHTVVNVVLVGSTVVQISWSDSKQPDLKQLTAVTTAQVRKLQGAAGP